jgi:hypothetical protein
VEQPGGGRNGNEGRVVGRTVEPVEVEVQPLAADAGGEIVPAREGLQRSVDGRETGRRRGAPEDWATGTVTSVPASNQAVVSPRNGASVTGTWA